MDDKRHCVTQFVNVSQDDALAWPGMAHRTYPSTVNAIKPFVEKSFATNNFLIDVFNDKLGLPKGTLGSFHKVYEHSGCTARVISASPYLGPEGKTFLVYDWSASLFSLYHNNQN